LPFGPKTALRTAGKLPRLWRGSPVPLYCQWDVTLRCNLNCRHCILSHYPLTDYQEMDTVASLDLIRKLRKAGTEIVYFCGGEPTLRRDLGVLLGEVKKQGMVSIVATNGQLLPAAFSSLRKADWVRVSINGDRETHDYLCRSPGSWDRSLAGVRLLHSRGVNVGINCVITKRMPRSSLENLLRTVSSLGIQVDFTPIGTDLRLKPGPEPSDRQSDVEEMRLPMDEFVRMVESLRREFGGVVTNPFIYRLLLREGGLSGLGCRAMNTSINVRPDGSYSFPCDFPVEVVRGDPGEALDSPEAVRARKLQGKYWFCEQCYSRCMVMPSLLVNPWRILQILVTYSRSVLRPREKAAADS